MSAIRTGALAALALLLAACADTAPTATGAVRVDAPAAAAAADPASLNRDLASVRAATARYHRVEAAEREGYAPASPCVAIPGAAMGVHYVNMGLIVDGVLEPARPEVLVYEPQADGSLKLVAVEYMIPVGMWSAQHGDTRPVLYGETFQNGPMGTYTLHAWVWRNNPWGTFAEFNPTVSCPVADAAAVAHAHH